METTVTTNITNAKNREWTCSYCGKAFSEDVRPIVDNNGQLYCSSCADDCLEYCDVCGEYYRTDETNFTTVNCGRYDGDYENWCEDCTYFQGVWKCVHCRDIFPDNPDAMYRVWNRDEYICPECAERDFVICEDCGYALNESEAEYVNGVAYCPTCAPYHSEKVIYGYHEYHPIWRALGDDLDSHCPMGVEVELDCGGESDYNAIVITYAGGYSALKEKSNSSPMFICSHDKGLDNGFKIVSQPATLSFHKDGRYGYDWEGLFKKARTLGYMAHDPGTCGLHVHIGRNWFKCAPFNDPEITLTLIVMNNSEWLKKFSRRRRWGYCRFPEEAKFPAETFESKEAEETETQKQHRKGLQEKLVDLSRNFFQGHGAALNFSNRHTLEIRFFRGTTKYSTFIATLQLVDMMAEAMKTMDLPDLAKINFRWFKERAAKLNYAEFLEYSESRHITGDEDFIDDYTED